MVKDGLAEFGLDNKSALRCKNMFALGLVCWLFERPLDEAMHMLQNKFAKKPAIAQANIKALTDGYNYGQTDRFALQRQTGTGCGSRSQATGKAGSDGSTDTGNFIFRLNSDDTKLLML